MSNDYKALKEMLENTKKGITYKDKYISKAKALDILLSQDFKEIKDTRFEIVIL